VSAVGDVETAWLNIEAPCDRCSLRGRCAKEYLACEAFSAFVCFKPWAATPRVPDRARYEAVFGAGVAKVRAIIKRRRAGRRQPLLEPVLEIWGRV
jgi:hypothetical protein